MWSEVMWLRQEGQEGDYPTLLKCASDKWMARRGKNSSYHEGRNEVCREQEVDYQNRLSGEGVQVDQVTAEGTRYESV